MLKISIYNDNITHFSHWTRVSEDAEDVNNITKKVDFYGVYVYIKLLYLNNRTTPQVQMEQSQTLITYCHKENTSKFYTVEIL